MSTRQCIVVLDDDPTGTQMATDVTVLLTWDADALAEVLADEDRVYLQTNSRALAEAEAVALVRGVRDIADEVSRRLGVEVRLVLRGDSTLRGHVFAESRAASETGAVTLFVPAFPDGGRITRAGVHLVAQGGRLVPVAETEYARDPVFGFGTSELAAFVEEGSDAMAMSVGIEAVRAGDVERILLDAPDGAFVLPDAETGDDISAIASAVQSAWDHRPVTVRSAAPLAAALAGVLSASPLAVAELCSSRPVLVVCGSHTDGAREQLSHLTERFGEPTVIDTVRALRNPEAEGARAASAEAALSRPGGLRLVATERHRRSAHGTLADGAAVMSALTTAAGLLADGVDLVVTKGGITSADVIRSSLGVRRARVLGQVAPGISVWQVDGRRRHRCVIVPGNMGDPRILADIVAWATDRS
ncbi:four-carbon acid sugar kinase family protein [Microbacterium tumbae]